MTFLGKTFTLADVRRVIWTALQAGFVAFLGLASGFWKAPNLESARALLIAVTFAAGAAALSAIKNWFLADASPAK